jgi:hypothetical protein
MRVTPTESRVQLQITETGAEDRIKWHEKGCQMDVKIDAKSSWRRGGVPGAFKERSTSNKTQNNAKTIEFSDPVLRHFLHKYWKILSGKAYKNKYKTVLEFQAKWFQKMTLECDRKGKIS